MDSDLLELLKWVSAPVFTLIGIWATNKYNLKNLKIQHTHALQKERAQRLYEYRKQIFEPVLVEFVRVHQTLAAAIDGKVTPEELLERAKACGVAVASTQLIASPATVRLVHQYSLLCNKTLLSEVLKFSGTLAYQKNQLNEMPDGPEKAKLDREYGHAVLASMERMAPKMEHLISESAQVTLAIRRELEIDTDHSEFSGAILGNAKDGRMFFAELISDMRKMLSQ
jgi:hypothetical protein